MSDDKRRKYAVLEKNIRENKLDFLYNLYLQNIPISETDTELLKKYKYIQEPVKEKGPFAEPDFINEHLHHRISENSRFADTHIDVVEGLAKTDKALDILTSHELEERRSLHGHIFEGRTTEIQRAEWLPKSKIYHEQDFIDWINSINAHGFHNQIQYRKFNLYCQQAYTWLQDNSNYTDFEDEEDREAWRQKELFRCQQNALYFLNRYIWYKEGDEETGKVKYTATKVHEFMAYMDDCGYSTCYAKGRQMAATTTMMALDVRDVIFKANHFMKFITEDVEKAAEIIEDKLKFAFANLPDWMRPDVLSERDNVFKMGYKEEKGKKEGVGSKIQLVAPKRTAVAGGSPQKVKIDEAGNISILGVMIGNARPTMMYYDKRTKKLVLKRQLNFWGCVCAGTKVWTNDGKLINIEDLKQQDGILGYNGNGVNKEPIAWIKPKSKKPCYRIETSGGNFLECSNDHPLFWSKSKFDFNGDISYDTKNGAIVDKKIKAKKITIKKAEDVKVGDQLAVIKEVPIFGKNKMWNPRLVGLLIGDGNYSEKSCITIGGQDEEIHEYLTKNFDAKEKFEKTYITKIGKKYRSFRLNGISKELKKLGIHGQTKENKRLPEDIHKYDKKSICELMAGIFDSDGHVKSSTRKGISIVLTASSFLILEIIKFQLVKLGIHSCICKEKRKSGWIRNAFRKETDLYRLYINDINSVLNFKKNIKLLIKEKQDKINLATNLKIGKKGEKTCVFVDPFTGKGKYFTSKTRLSNLRFEFVKSVKYIGKKDIYNITAADTHTYLSNNFVNANTGGEMDKGGKAFETEMLALMKQWANGIYDSAIVPVFFDWKCRPGATQEDYDREKRVAYAKGDNDQDPDAKRHITEFHQSWPTSLSDVFRTASKTLVDEQFIEAALKRIADAKKKHKFKLHQSGYFEPIYDITRPTDEGSDVPYKIIGADFIPTEDMDRRASVTIFMQPDRNYKDRYYQGTDPIDTYTGLSNMASTIWDKWWKTPAAIVNWRVPDYPQVFLQCTLLSLYYDNKAIKTGIKELIESNRGTSYYEYRKAKGLDKELVLNYQLPFTFQNKTTINDGVGIDNKGIRSVMIINQMHDMFSFYGTNIYHEVMYEQAKTFTCSVSEHGKEIWGPINKKYFMDDTLYSGTYAYICSEIVFANVEPKNIESVKNKYEMVSKLVRGPDKKLRRVTVKQKVKI